MHIQRNKKCCQIITPVNFVTLAKVMATCVVSGMSHSYSMPSAALLNGFIFLS